MPYLLKRRLFFALLLAALSLPPAAPEAADAVSESGVGVSGVWLVEARNRRTRDNFALELTVADDHMHSGALRFVDSNISAAFARSVAAGSDFHVECPFTQSGENLTIVLRGTITGDMWVGRYRIVDSGGERVAAGRFTGRRADGPPKERADIRPGFPGVWLGHYEVFGERFRVRFHVEDEAGKKGVVLMPDEAIRAAISGCSTSGDTTTLSATWEIPELNLTARVEFSGRMEGDRWAGNYVVFAAGKAQPLASGAFYARPRSDGEAERRNRSGIASLLAQPPHSDGLLEGEWRGYYRNAGRDFGLAVEIRISENRYIGAVLLPEDRLEATVFYAGDTERQAQVIGLSEPLDGEPDGDAMTINLAGELRDGVWRGEYVMESDSVKLNGPFFLTKK